jgi:hypothetical protein
MACLVALAATYGCATSQRETTIKATFLGLDAARDSFLAYDRSHEMSLTAHCDPAVESRDACVAKVTTSTAKLAEYQASRAKIDQLFTAAFRSLTAAQILDTDQSIASAIAAASQLFAAVKPFLGGK